MTSISQQLTIPKIKLSGIIEEIQDSILLKLFGSEYINVKTLLQTSSQIVKTEGYEFELRFIDDNARTTSKQLWYNFFSQPNMFELIAYEDDIIYTYQPSIPIHNVHIRSYQKSNMYERKMLINSISSRNEDKTITPLKINLSKEFTMSPNKELTRYDNIQRRQRCSYKFTSSSPYLANWRVDKTIRLITNTIQDKKLSVNLTIDNLDVLTYYDFLDIEFEYIGDYAEIQLSFFELIRTIYQSYEYFDVEYLIIKACLSSVIPSNLMTKNILSLQPQPLMLTNDVLQQSSIKDYIITNKYSGNHSMLIIYGEPGNYIAYNLEQTKLNKVAGNLSILNIGKPVNDEHNIESLLKAFNENKHIDYLPTMYVFEAMTNDKFILTDTIVYENTLVQDQNLTQRRKYITNFISEFKLPDKFMFAPIVKSNTWSDVLEKKDKSFICKPINEPLFDSKIYKITYHEQITINFKVMYVPIKRVFYLYVIGDPKEVIEAKTINNKYSNNHFGYSLLNSNTPNECYLLYVSPYMKESYILKPSLHTNNRIINDMYVNPMKYNGLIIKMTRTNDESAEWQPLSIHTSSDKPESYLNALKLESLIFDHLKVNTYNPNKQLLPIKSIYQTVYEILDQYTIEKTFMDKKLKTVLDIINDGNSNASLLYNVASVNHVFCASNNKHTLTNFIEQATDKSFSKHTFLQSTCLRTNDQQFSISSVYSPLTYTSLIPELNKKWNYLPKTIDLVYFEDDFQQINSLVDVINFRKLCESVLSPNGRILLKLFDGNKITEIIENKHKNNDAVKVSKRKRNIEKTLSIEYINDDFIDSRVIEHTKSNTKKLLNLLNATKLSTNYVEIGDGNVLKFMNKEVRFPDNYNLSAYCHEQLNTLVMIATYYMKHNEDMGTERLVPVSLMKNLQKILGVNVELFGNAFNRVYDKFCSTCYEVDELIGAIDNTSNVINNCININDGVLIIKDILEQEEIDYINTRKNCNYSTAVITYSELDIPNHFVVNDELNLYVIYPHYASNDDITNLNTIIENHITNNEQIFKYYTHPKFSSCQYIKRMVFNLDFLNFLNESFKLVDITNPLTQNEIANYVATNRQFTQISSIEQYLNAYTIITFERL